MLHIVGDDVIVRQEEHAPKEMEKNGKLEQVQDTVHWLGVVVLGGPMKPKNHPLVNPVHQDKVEQCKHHDEGQRYYILEGNPDQADHLGKSGIPDVLGANMEPFIVALK
jgi:hypothetical protein